MAIPGIDESPYSRVYQKIVDQLTTDPALEAAGVRFIPWDGSTKNVRPTTARSPTIELFPTLSSQEWMSPDAFRGDMVVVVRMYVPNCFNAKDCMDLWAAVERAIYPAGDRQKQLDFEERLRGCDEGSCDAETGQVKFVRPAMIQPQFNGDKFAHFECVGEMSISIIRPLNP